MNTKIVPSSRHYQSIKHLKDRLKPLLFCICDTVSSSQLCYLIEREKLYLDCNFFGNVVFWTERTFQKLIRIAIRMTSDHRLFNTNWINLNKIENWKNNWKYVWNVESWWFLRGENILLDGSNFGKYNSVGKALKALCFLWNGIRGLRGRGGWW